MTPPAWDPLGAAPFAWDLPEPGPSPRPHRGAASRVTPVTLALALLAGGVTALVLLAAGGLTDLPVLFGVLLAVLGGGLLVGAFTRSGRGLIPVALLVVALTWGALAAPLDRIARRAAAGPAAGADDPGRARAAATTAGVGTIELDLRRMDLTVPPGAAAHTGRDDDRRRGGRRRDPGCRATPTCASPASPAWARWSSTTRRTTARAPGSA